MPTWLEYGLAFVLILLASELFTNGVEWAGHRLHLGQGATGSLLAAFGTALPETVVPIVAVVRRSAESQDVAVGAVLGAPFLLLTLGTGVTGVAVWLRRRDPVLRVDAAQVRRDVGTYFAGAALLAVALVLPLAARGVVAVLLLGVYGYHVVGTLRGDEGRGEAPEPLHLWRWRGPEPPVFPVVLQLAVSVGILVYGAHLFVDALDATASELRISALVLAIVLVPLATELPETFNSVLWVRSGDDMLAFGNVAGATAFQACIPGAIGVAFTDWRPGPAGLIDGAITLVAGAWVLLLLRDGRCRGWRLAGSALPWAAYVALALALGDRLAAAPAG